MNSRSPIQQKLVSRISTADRLNRHNLNNFMQQSFWGDHKSQFGWKQFWVELFVEGVDSADGSLAILMLERSLGGGFSFAYIPHAPDETWVEARCQQWNIDRGNLLTCCSTAIRPLLGSGCVFIRYDLAWHIGNHDTHTENDQEELYNAAVLREQVDLCPLVKASSDVQPPDTVILDLASGHDSVLAGMKPKTRYNIRLAEKKGVRVEKAGLDRFDDWYELYKMTASRDHIAVHNAEYYRALFDRNPKNMELLLAWHEDDLLAGTIMMYAGDTATYLYGASSNHKRNLMPAYALQWAGINSAIARSCRYYDFGGLPPSNDPTHPMHGLWQFKTGFGGNLVSMPGCWDRPYNIFLYRLLRLAEKARHFYFKRLKKRR